jgi:HPt (histidine-containing phosphotransfer) domain-containing protein
MSKKCAQLLLAYKEKDMKVLHYAAHTLKGGASNLGTTAFIDICRQIEESAIENSFEGIEKVKDAFETESRRVLEALQILSDRQADSLKHS